MDKTFIDTLRIFYDEKFIFEVQNDIEKEYKNLKWLQDNLDKIIKKASESLKSGFEKAYKKVKLKYTFDGLVNPIEDTVDIFVAHSDTASEIRHTGLLAYFLENKEILKAFLHNFKLYEFDDFVAKGQFKVVSEYCIFNEEYNKKECRFDVVIFFGNNKAVSAYDGSVVIEAKVYSKENTYRIGQNEVAQRELYQKTIAENPKLFGECTCLYLTLEKDENISNNFRNITWLEVLVALQRYILNINPDNRKSAYLNFLQLWIGCFLGYVYKCPKENDFDNKKSLKNKDKLISFIKQLVNDEENR